LAGAVIAQCGVEGASFEDAYAALANVADCAGVLLSLAIREASTALSGIASTVAVAGRIGDAGGPTDTV
jgi:hypothetical protein